MELLYGYTGVFVDRKQEIEDVRQPINIFSPTFELVI